MTKIMFVLLNKTLNCRTPSPEVCRALQEVKFADCFPNSFELSHQISERHKKPKIQN